ncbi:hypothetical protein BGW80DRAFT_1487856 [Lactifluus volemus]|nr:hypothetical protein BGW80DRAFT_1487856 [Lactifluus volemus]
MTAIYGLALKVSFISHLPVRWSGLVASVSSKKWMKCLENINKVFLCSSRPEEQPGLVRVLAMQQQQLSIFYYGDERRSQNTQSATGEDVELEVVYYRAGYTPSDSGSSANYATRVLLGWNVPALLRARASPGSSHTTRISLRRRHLGERQLDVHVGWSLCDRAEEAERHAKESSCSNPSGSEAETTHTLAGEAASLVGHGFDGWRWESERAQGVWVGTVGIYRKV